MMVIRKSTVEPIIGNLIEYLGMRKVNTIGIKLANKCMIMAGIAYNLKKLIKYGVKMSKNAIAGHLEKLLSECYMIVNCYLLRSKAITTEQSNFTPSVV